MVHMSAQCYVHRFGYCTNAKTCFNVHFRPILAERRVLLGRLILITAFSRFYFDHSVSYSESSDQVSDITVSAQTSIALSETVSLLSPDQSIL